MQHRNVTVCPIESMGNYDDCLHSLLHNVTSPLCRRTNQKINRSCISTNLQQFTLLSRQAENWQDRFLVINRKESDQVVKCGRSELSITDHKATIIVPKKNNPETTNITINIINTNQRIQQIQHIDATNEEVTKLKNKLMDTISNKEKQVIAKLDMAEERTQNHTALINSAFETLDSVGNQLENIPKAVGGMVNDAVGPVWNTITSTITPILIIGGIMAIIALIIAAIVNVIQLKQKNKIKIGRIIPAAETNRDSPV